MPYVLPMSNHENTNPTIPSRGAQVADAVESGDVKIMDLSEQDYIDYMNYTDPFYFSIEGGAYDDRWDSDLTGCDAARDQVETHRHDAEVLEWERQDRAWTNPF